MKGHDSRARSNKALRRILALSFLVLLLAEWGSHAAIYANSSTSEGAAIYSNENSHEDPCKTLVRCSDGQRQNQHVLKLTHNTSQHNGFVPRLCALGRAGVFHDDGRFAQTNLRALFRPPDPLFHPPEIN